VYDKQELLVPVEYYASLYPTQFVEEEAARAAKKEAKAESRAARVEGALAARPAGSKPTVEEVGQRETGAAAQGGQAAPAKPRLTPEEIERRKAEAAARRAQRQAKGDGEGS
jgi:hypothetical protein